MIVQIYEIQDPWQAERCIELDVNHIGSVLLSKEQWRTPSVKEVIEQSKGTQVKNSLLPLFKDLERLFKEVLNKTYTREEYQEQFMVRIPENISKIDRIEEIYRTKVADAPEELLTVLEDQRKRLQEAQAKFGDYIDVEKFM